ncbi:unnamed protein product (macronuclear) [Paramecium tetraurelia]|uniref:Exonuclease domain-containing protein n=1 Tax=Paramecium tetraurelia TaxID=5888 RepID=A0BUQ6_PARTE|nr:uncharacterized protein GSPATT00005519001 [Paramecium tetraurelia]CAK62273.1 unnamed protein product [Paramecium tetraurelia]|eukprot:XP_001429671.1 hypothetical protein (macronuclear) [Paramecium tetraurelia strain d4-2]
MFNKVLHKQVPQELQKLQTITEAIQNFDVRFPVPGSQNQTGSILAIDCEMVECKNEIGASVQMLARITVVNYNGYVVLDQYYKPRFKVRNYITRISGITPQIIKDKPVYNDFEKQKLQLLFKDKTIIGHTLKSDFDAMEFDLFNESRLFEIRGGIKQYSQLNKGLKKMCLKYLGQNIQQGQHSSEIDARATLFIFRKFRNEINLHYKQLDLEQDKQRIQKKNSQKNSKNQRKRSQKEVLNKESENQRKQCNEPLSRNDQQKQVQIQKKQISKKKSS